jgi:hypothetical protein
MKYLKIFESFDDVTITIEDGKLIINYQNKPYRYQVEKSGLDVSLDKIVKQPNDDYKITAFKGSKLFSQEIDLSKKRYDAIITTFKNHFDKNKVAPPNIVSNPLPNTPGKPFNLILI